MTRRYSSCSYCGSSVDERHVRMELWIGDSLVVFEDVPAGVCSQCGEEYISADIQDKMFALSKTPAKKKMEVPVYLFTDPLSVAKAVAKRKKKLAQEDVKEEEDIRGPSDEELAQLLDTDFGEWEEDDE